MKQNNIQKTSFDVINSTFWSKFIRPKRRKGLLLIECSNHPIVIHANAVAARMIKEAKGCEIGWLNFDSNKNCKKLLSYDETSQIVQIKKKKIFEKFFLFSKYIFLSIKLLFLKEIVTFSMDGICFGDILYDSYLAYYEVATISKLDIKVFKILFILIINHYNFKKTILKNNISYVLVSHQVGLNSGVLMRTALKYGVLVYLRSAGNGKIALNLFKSIYEVYNYPYRPTSQEMLKLSKMDDSILDKEFQDLIEKRIFSLTDMDAIKAYDKNKKLYVSKKEFAKKYACDSEKQFVFVMLHAFNDHPHTHFGKMVFKDYYDWFINTLKIAKRKSNVIWVFKEHPSTIYYPTKDVSLSDHFKNCPTNIIFLPFNELFNSMSIKNIADVTVTVSGTAGVEFAALSATPTILSGKSVYSGFGFALEATSKSEYFEYLSNVEKIPKLDKNKQKIAQQLFLYIQRYSYVKSKFFPLCSFEETKDKNLNSYYWNRVIDAYDNYSDTILKEYKTLSDFIRKDDFSRLSNLNIIP